ncbi:MAG: EF-hand domain-containing protein [Luteolibacter sp.]
MKIKNLIIAGVVLGTVTTGYSREKTFGDGQLPSFLADFDTNGDNSIDEEERQAIVAFRNSVREGRRADIDKDGNGEISDQERKDARDSVRKNIEAKRKKHFEELAGEDGVLSLEEFSTLHQLASVPERVIAAIFQRLDTDASGGVTFEEFTARLRNHKPRPDGDKPDDDAPDDDAPDDDAPDGDDAPTAPN